MSKTRSRAKSAAALARAKSSVHADPRVAPIEAELEAWRTRAIPDASAPLEAEDVARLVRDCLMAFGAAEAGESFSVNTVHYYRRKDILDEPDGRTAAARYGLHHVWQAVGARLAGFLSLVTLAEARDVIRGAPDDTLRRFVAARVADVRARAAARAVVAETPAVVVDETVIARPLSLPPTKVAAVASIPTSAASGATANVIALGGDALCLIPSNHPALASHAAARALVNALARELGLKKS
jgi:hypothetical protein